MVSKSWDFGQSDLSKWVEDDDSQPERPKKIIAIKKVTKSRSSSTPRSTEYVIHEYPQPGECAIFTCEVTCRPMPQHMAQKEVPRRRSRSKSRKLAKNVDTADHCPDNNEVQKIENSQKSEKTTTLITRLNPLKKFKKLPLKPSDQSESDQSGVEIIPPTRNPRSNSLPSISDLNAKRRSRPQSDIFSDQSGYETRAPTQSKTQSDSFSGQSDLDTHRPTRNRPNSEIFSDQSEHFKTSRCSYYDNNMHAKNVYFLLNQIEVSLEGAEKEFTDSEPINSKHIQRKREWGQEREMLLARCKATENSQQVCFIFI